VGLPSFDETSLEVALIVRLPNPRPEDEGRSHWEDHVVKIRRGLDRYCAASPYLARQLSVFDCR
jgi:hypothetical protein